LIREHFKVVTETVAPTFMPHMRFVKPLPSNPSTPPIPIRFVATLDPPMPVSDEISQKLMNITGLTSPDTGSVPATTNILIKNQQTSHTQSLESILVVEVGDNAFEGSNSWVSVSKKKRHFFCWLYI
jgi:hypothetical protein